MDNFFSCPYGQRPQRLSPATRFLAHRVLSGEWGRWLKDTPYLLVEDPEAFQKLPPVRKHAYAIGLIARKAPIRLTEGEYLAGASTLGGAAKHYIPVCLPENQYMEPNSKKFFCDSTSHLTLGFEKALKIGYKGLREEIWQSTAVHSAGLGDPERESKLEFLQSLMDCIDAATLWHSRYMQALAQRIETSLGPVRRRYEEIYQNLKNVPENPPRNFREAVQALWFLFDFQRLCGNWPGIGRIDKMLGGFLQSDLDSGAITLEEAREYLAHFWIKGAEWVNGTNEDIQPDSGDGQNYQNIILSGIDEDGKDVTNLVTYLVLDVVEELGISDFPISVRLSPETDPRLLRRVAEVLKLGGGILAVYNEPIVLEALTKFGYPLREARNFTNDGCWELQIPGKTCFRYDGYDLLRIFQQQALKMHLREPSALPYHSFEELFEAYSKAGAEYLQKNVFDRAPECVGHGNIALMASLLTEDCIAKAKNYWSGGAKYTVYSPHPGGLPDVANSLHAINQIVYQQKKLTLNQLVDLMKSDWKGNEALRQSLRNKITYYGNDDPEADAMMKRVYDDYTDHVASCHALEGYLHPAGISTFGRQIKWAAMRMATPDGHHAGDVLSHNIDPAPGTDLKGATAVIKSYSKLDLTKLPGGTALTVKLLPSVLKGEEGTEALENLLQGFLAVGGLFFQPDILDVETLLEAQKHPEQYENLSVRVSGWSARFNSLDKQWQNMVIQSTYQQL